MFRGTGEGNLVHKVKNVPPVYLTAKVGMGGQHKFGDGNPACSG